MNLLSLLEKDNESLERNEMSHTRRSMERDERANWTGKSRPELGGRRAAEDIVKESGMIENS